MRVVQRYVQLRINQIQMLIEDLSTSINQKCKINVSFKTHVAHTYISQVYTTLLE